MSTTTSPAIEACGLTKRFGDVHALDGLDLVVETGTVLGLLGPNGAGKTTADSILTTLLKPDSGKATVAGADLFTEPQLVRERIGRSGQYAAVDEALTGRGNLVMIGRLHHLPKQRAKARANELRERFDLTEAGDRPVKGDSGGMRRRLDLAGALVAQPPVLFLMSTTGFLVGWRIRSSVLEALGGFLLPLVFAYALSWVMAYVALLVPSVEVINNASFIVIFPLTFIANTFVPSDDLPGPLKVFAEWNPVSAVTQASRELFGNLPVGAPEPTVWALANPVVYTLIWAPGIVSIFAPLSVRRYARKAKG